MPQSPTIPCKNKDKINNPKLNTLKTNNGDPNQRTIQLNKNKLTATKIIHASDVKDTSNNDNSSSGGRISSTSNKNKRIHSNSSDSMLSQDDPPSASPSNDNNTVPTQNPTDSINRETIGDSVGQNYGHYRSFNYTPKSMYNIS
ncbi:hypothetical protein QTP88_020172 [Uroleucon formosanum]